MTEHPYAGADTLTPGEVADDDPFSEEEECRNCGDFVTPIPETDCCPQCGEEIQ